MRLHTRSGGGSPGADAVSLQPRQHRGAQGSAAPIPIFTHLAAVPPVLHERLDRIDPAGSICTVSSTSQPGPTHYPHSRCHAKGPPPARPLPTRPSVPERRAVAFEPSITAQTPTCVLYTPPRRHVRAIGRPVVSIGRASGVHASFALKRRRAMAAELGTASKGKGRVVGDEEEAKDVLPWYVELAPHSRLTRQGGKVPPDHAGRGHVPPAHHEHMCVC